MISFSLSFYTSLIYCCLNSCKYFIQGKHEFCARINSLKRVISWSQIVIFRLTLSRHILHKDMSTCFIGMCKILHRLLLNTPRLRQNGRHFQDDIFKCIFEWKCINFDYDFTESWWWCWWWWTRMSVLKTYAIFHTYDNWENWRHIGSTVNRIYPTGIYLPLSLHHLFHIMWTVLWSNVTNIA